MEKPNLTTAELLNQIDESNYTSDKPVLVRVQRKLKNDKIDQWDIYVNSIEVASDGTLLIIAKY